MAETKHSSDMVVARVVEAIGKCMVGSSLEEQAIAALAASHHAELVAALERAAAATRTLARNILDDVGPGTCDGWVSALNTISRSIDADLAKIGGDQ